MPSSFGRIRNQRTGRRAAGGQPGRLLAAPGSGRYTAGMVPAARGGTQAMIEARGLTKRFGDKLAVDQLTFSVDPGRITGFLGPNGAGKTTTMRLILGLDRPTRGAVTVHGKEFSQLAYPMHEVGALLDAKAVHGGRSAYNHLLWLAQSNGLPRARVSEVLELVGLTEVAG